MSPIVTDLTLAPCPLPPHLRRDRPPLKLVLHLTSPPTDKLILSNSVESCKTAFMGSVKEGDFVRWGNVKRVTGLRRGEQDGLWEGVKTSESLYFVGERSEEISKVRDDVQTEVSGMCTRVGQAPGFCHGALPSSDSLSLRRLIRGPD